MRNSAAARSAVGCNFRLARSILRDCFRGFAELIAAQSKASSSPIVVCSLPKEASDVPDITQSKYFYVSAARDNGAGALCKYYSTESIRYPQQNDHTRPFSHAIILITNFMDGQWSVLAGRKVASSAAITASLIWLTDSIDFKLSRLSVAASGSGLYPSRQLQLNPFLEPAVSQSPGLVGRIPDFVYPGFRNSLFE